MLAVFLSNNPCFEQHLLADVRHLLQWKTELYSSQINCFGARKKDISATLFDAKTAVWKKAR